MGERVPIVDYLVLDDGDPHLAATVCQDCGATCFERRNACARCFGTGFGRQRVAGSGNVRSFTIVHRAAPGIPVPYVSAIVELDGGGVVRANLRDVEPAPEAVVLGMAVTMTTFVAATADDGAEVVAFGYSPAPAGGRRENGA